MFCKNCGKELADGIGFCSECGTKTETQSIQTKSKSQKAGSIISKVGKKGIAIISVSVVCLVAIIAIIISSVTATNNTPEKVAEKFVTAAFSGDPESLVECVPDFMLRKLSSQMGLVGINKKALISALKSQISLDDIQTVTVINSVRDYGFEYSEYTEELQEEYGATYSDISQLKDACAIKVSVFLDGENEEYYVVCIKLKNKWYALDID